MARLSARQIALGALRTWRRERRFADSVISRSFAKTDLTKSDRAFALELFYGVLRNLTLLDFWIGCVRASRIDVDLRDILRLGLYQLFFLETAQHAAVFETVALAPKKQLRGGAGHQKRERTQRRPRMLGGQPEEAPGFCDADEPGGGNLRANLAERSGEAGGLYSNDGVHLPRHIVMIAGLRAIHVSKVAPSL